MSKLFTVGIPVYNSMPYLKEAVESVLAQTVSDFKILAIVDDCNDGSIEYMESIRDSRLRIIRQTKSGLTPTLNRMLREIDTPWLVRQDSDDVSYPTRIEKLLSYAKRSPDVGMFYSEADYHPRETCVGQFRCTRGTPSELRRVAASGYLLSLCHTSVVLNREKSLSIGGYREDVYVEDIDMWWRMALAYDIQFIPESLVGFRQNPNQSTSRFMFPQALQGLYIQYLLLSHIWGHTPRPSAEVEPLLRSFVSETHLQAKERLRRANMLLAERKYAHAVIAGIQSLLKSPGFFCGRLRDEFYASSPITNGVNPEFFLQRKSEFWP